MAPDDVLIRIAARNAGQSQPNSTSYQRSGSATDGPGMAPFPNLSFVTCPTRRARWSSPRTKSLAHGSSSPALILQAVRPRFSFATTRRTSRRSLAAPRQHPIPRMASTTTSSVVRPRSIPNDAERRWPVGAASRSEPERRPRSGSGSPATRQARRSISATRSRGPKTAKLSLLASKGTSASLPSRARSSGHAQRFPPSRVCSVGTLTCACWKLDCACRTTLRRAIWCCVCLRSTFDERPRTSNRD